MNTNVSESPFRSDGRQRNLAAGPIPPEQRIFIAEKQEGKGPFLQPKVTAKVISSAEGSPVLKGTLLPRSFVSHRLTLTDYNEEAVIGLVTGLRGDLAESDDLAKRIAQHRANLEEMNSALPAAMNSADVTEAEVMKLTVIRDRLPLVESRVADLDQKISSLRNAAAEKVSELRDQIFLAAELVHHGNAALADTPETPVKGPWVGSEVNTFAFLLLQQPHYANRHGNDLVAEDIFDLARSVIEDAEKLVSEITRLENEFKGDVPIRIRGDAAAFTRVSGSPKFFNLKETHTVRFFLIDADKNTFGAAGSCRLPDGTIVHPEHIHGFYGPKDFADAPVVPAIPEAEISGK